jgi:hypothetical protein
MGLDHSAGRQSVLVLPGDAVHCPVRGELSLPASASAFSGVVLAMVCSGRAQRAANSSRSTASCEAARDMLACKGVPWHIVCRTICLGLIGSNQLATGRIRRL